MGGPGGDFQIRKAMESDAATIVAWFGTPAEATLWGGPAVPADFNAAWLAREISGSGIYRIVSTAHGAIIGVYGLRPFPSEQRVHIQRVAVEPSHRRKGLGRMLVADAVAQALAQHAETISLNVYGSNVSARKMYEGLGFRALKTRDAPEDVSGVSVYMERPVLLTPRP